MILGRRASDSEAKKVVDEDGGRSVCDVTMGFRRIILVGLCRNSRTRSLVMWLGIGAEVVVVWDVLRNDAIFAAKADLLLQERRVC